MELLILNKSFQPVSIIEGYTSLIWTKRYYGYGDFELYIPADPALLDVLKTDYFITRSDDESVMIIEKIEIKTDVENGDYFIITGRSLESILMRRIFDMQYIFDSTYSLAIVVQSFVIYCTTNRDLPRTYRQIPNLTVDTSSNFDGTMKVQFTGDTLYSAIVSVCQPRDVGFKITLSGNQMTLYLYQGEEVDVEFSQDFDNLISSDYKRDTSDIANYIYVAGEGEGMNRRIFRRAFFNLENPKSGLDLHEVWVDARNISSNSGAISTPDYEKMLEQRAYEAYAEHSIDESFEAEVEPQITFEYKTDWNLGDIVTVKNAYGVTSKPRIVEIIECWDETGYSVIPTFDSLEVV